MKLSGLVAILLLATWTQAVAVTHAKKTATVTIKGSVPAACSLTTAPFGFTIGTGYIHSPGNTILKQNALGVKCTKHATTQISMNYGLYGNAAGAQFGSRSMSDGVGDYLGYELCHDNACSQIWTPSGYNYVSPTDAGSSLPIWTRIITGQSHAKQGQYSDAVTVTISF